MQQHRSPGGHLQLRRLPLSIHLIDCQLCYLQRQQHCSPGAHLQLLRVPFPTRFGHQLTALLTLPIKMQQHCSPGGHLQLLGAAVLLNHQRVVARRPAVRRGFQGGLRGSKYLPTVRRVVGRQGRTSHAVGFADGCAVQAARLSRLTTVRNLGEPPGKHRVHHAAPLHVV